MTKVNRTVMEMRHVSYVERPNAIRKFLMNGFSIEDICVTRVSACYYDIVAIKNH